MADVVDTNVVEEPVTKEVPQGEEEVSNEAEASTTVETPAAENEETPAVVDSEEKEAVADESHTNGSAPVENGQKNGSNGTTKEHANGDSENGHAERKRKSEGEGTDEVADEVAEKKAKLSEEAKVAEDGVENGSEAQAVA